MPRCYYCGKSENLERQIAGFWFCFHCLPRAEANGAWYWTRLAHLSETPEQTPAADRR